jgi:metallo-beta-lactamase class B
VTPKRRILFAVGLVTGLAAGALPLFGEDAKILQLAIGDPARKDREAPLVLDGVTDTRTGAVLTPAELAARLAGVRLLLIGESHTSTESHRVQLAALQELVAAGRKVRLGLEMFPTGTRLDFGPWRRGEETEEAFVERIGWFDHWGYNWGYYREIFLLAKEHHLEVVGVNAPRTAVTTVRAKGFAGLAPEERTGLPPTIDTESEDHRTLLRAFFGADDPTHSVSDELFGRMVESQTTWDGTMAHHALAELAQAPPDTLVVVLVGSGHVIYDLGIARQARGYGFTAPIATLVPVPVLDDAGAPVATLRASFADFVWGVEAEEENRFPEIGLSTTEAKLPEGGSRRKILFLDPDSRAAKAGLAAGDVLLTVDGVDVPTRVELNRALTAKRWGDRVTVEVLRGAEKQTFQLVLRRAGALPAASLDDDTERSWSQPFEPVKIADNLFYVGASDLASYLFTTAEGHILIDGGFAETAPIIEANLARLGVRLADVKILLNTHVHNDHAGGLARLKERTGAKLYLMAADAELAARGGKGDFAFGDDFAFPPAEADGLLENGATVTLGGVTLTAHHTPGHTRGNTTWTTSVRDGDRELRAVIIASMSVNPGVVLLDNPLYPEIARDYERSFEILEKLPCDLFLAPHGSFFDLAGKTEQRRQGASPNPFIDPDGYRDHLAKRKTAFDKRVAEERAKQP